MLKKIPASHVISWSSNPVAPKPAKPRKRTFHHKTREGCITCKKRRVKCDQERPSCCRCTKRGLQCEGYDVPRTWIFQTSDNSSAATATNNLPPKANPSWNESFTLTEQRALGYWIDRSQSELAAYTFAASSLWTKLLPQMFQTNETLRSAIVAVATLHEETRSRLLPAHAAANNALFNKNYSKAVRDLTSNDPTPSREVILICCLLFLACENLRESALGVMFHLRSGLKVLREWHSQSISNAGSNRTDPGDILYDLVEPIFARLEAQTSIMPSTANERPNYAEYDLNWKRPSLPEKFVNLLEARNGMHDIIQYMWYELQPLKRKVKSGDPMYSNFLRNMTAWRVVFKKSFPRCDDPEWAYHKAVLVIMLHHRAVLLGVRVEASADPLYIDQYEGEVEAMLDDAATVILDGKPESDFSEYGFSNIWDHDFSIEPPLILLALYCRNPTLRQRAIHLKRVHHCWWSDSASYGACSTARLCELAMQKEEQSSLSATGTHLSPGLQSEPAGTSPAPPPRTPPTFIPPEHRINVLRCIFERPYKLAIEYEWANRPRFDPAFPDLHTAEVDWPSWTPPPIPYVTTYPFTAAIKHGGSLGLLRPLRDHCHCKSLGTAGGRVLEAITNDGATQLVHDSNGIEPDNMSPFSRPVAIQFEAGANEVDLPLRTPHA